jgi:hypothetical protein
MMSANHKQTKVRALVLLLLANVGAGTFVYYGIRSHFAPMFILGVVYGIFNSLLFVFALIEPLKSNRELRDAVLWFCFENCCFIGGIFRGSGDQWRVISELK